MNAAVVIPTYDRARMVVDAVESALAQTEPCRVVVVDDGSTDDTLERLAAFGDAITVLARENRERGAARNAGAREAAGADLLCFLDADDVMEPDHVSELTSLAAGHPGAPLVTRPVAMVDRSLRPLGPEGAEEAGPVTLEAFLLGRDRAPQGATAYRREVFDEVGGFDERRQLAGSEDWLLNARVLARGAGVRGAGVGVRLRRHPANTMGDAESMERSMLLAHRIFFERWWPEERRLSGARQLGDDVRRRSRARLLLNAATQHYAVGSMSRARSTLLEALQADPAIALDPRWAWTWLRSLLGRRLSSALRSLKEGASRGGPG